MKNPESPRRGSPGARSALFAALAVPLVLAAAGASAKTLVFCSEGSPENFYPGVNTTGTSFDANSQIYGRIVDFERGGTRVVPGRAGRGDISPDGKVYTFHLRKGVKWHNHRAYKPTRDFNADDMIFGLFRRTWYADGLHLVSALWAAAAALTSRRASEWFFQLFGVFYFADGVLGLLTGSGYLDFGILINGIRDLPLMTRIFTNAPHLGLGGVAILIGYVLAPRAAVHA